MLVGLVRRRGAWAQAVGGCEIRGFPPTANAAAAPSGRVSSDPDPSCAGLGIFRPRPQAAAPSYFAHSPGGARHHVGSRNKTFFAARSGAPDLSLHARGP